MKSLSDIKSPHFISATNCREEITKRGRSWAPFCKRARIPSLHAPEQLAGVCRLLPLSAFCFHAVRLSLSAFLQCSYADTLRREARQLSWGISVLLRQVVCPAISPVSNTLSTAEPRFVLKDSARQFHRAQAVIMHTCLSTDCIEVGGIGFSTMVKVVLIRNSEVGIS